MSSTADRMKLKLRTMAGLPPYTPTDAQLAAIIDAVTQMAGGRPPTDEEWRRAAELIVPGAGTYAYAGEDMSSLNTLLTMIQSTSPKPGSGGNSTRR